MKIDNNFRTKLSFIFTNDDVFRDQEKDKMLYLRPFIKIF